MSEELKQVTHIDNVRLGEGEKSVVIIDQTQLPNRTVYLTLRTPEEMYDAIKLLQVRGAPAIGICAGYSIYALARQWEIGSYTEFAQKFHEQKEYLNSSRPTAVNLSWALNRMETAVSALPTVSAIRAAFLSPRAHPSHQAVFRLNVIIINKQRPRKSYQKDHTQDAIALGHIGVPQDRGENRIRHAEREYHVIFRHA